VDISSKLGRETAKLLTKFLLNDWPLRQELVTPHIIPFNDFDQRSRLPFKVVPGSKGFSIFPSKSVIGRAHKCPLLFSHAACSRRFIGFVARSRKTLQLPRVRRACRPPWLQSESSLASEAAVRPIFFRLTNSLIRHQLHEFRVVIPPGCDFQRDAPN
jgi:hypothetical protein